MKKLKIYLIPTVFLFGASITGAYFNMNEQSNYAANILIPKEIKKNNQKIIKSNSLIEKYKDVKITPFEKIEYIVKSGDSIYSILNSFGLSTYEISDIIDSIKKFDKDLLKLRINDKVRINKKDNLIHSFDFFRNSTDFTKIVLKNSVSKEIIIYNDSIYTETKERNIKGTIKSSLYIDGLEAGLDDSLVIQLANIFAWDIDFSRDIDVNDEFTVLFNEVRSGDKKISNGDIIAAVFKTRSKTYYAFRYEENNRVGYYDENGKNLEKAFIRSPVKFPIITSKFNLKRFHPVLKINRPHRGVDYGGKLNTPIMSTGSGTITYRGRKGGFGNVVIVDHKQGYQTLYAHLNKFNGKHKLGSVVSQGEIVGYMGQTGLATGVHLHYEMTINGKHQDSLKLKLPDGKSVSNIQSFNNFKEETIEKLRLNHE